jgi:ATP-dependent Lon protease
VATLCRKIARIWARRKSDRKSVRITEDKLADYLGPAIYQQEFASRTPEVGIATGLAWTGLGGAILFIEAAKMPGSGAVRVTGRLGEVMRESVDAAFTYVRSRADSLEIDTARFKQLDVHIHFPEGATPKDGPSAGVAVATCLASLLSGRPVRHDVAMTGEITLRGKVLSVGGIQEKLLAAHRARIHTVILPEGNRKDLMRVPELTLGDLNVVFAERVSDVWREALVPLMVIRKEDLGQFREQDYLPQAPYGRDESS